MKNYLKYFEFQAKRKIMFEGHLTKTLFDNYDISQEKMFEASSSDFSNRTGFSESLVGRAINGIFSMFGKKIQRARLASYRHDLENEYLAGVIRACIHQNISSSKATNASNVAMNWTGCIQYPNTICVWNAKVNGFKGMIQFTSLELPQDQKIKVSLIKGGKEIMLIKDKASWTFDWDDMPDTLESGEDYQVRVTIYKNDGTTLSNMFIDSDKFEISNLNEAEFITHIKEKLGNEINKVNDDYDTKISEEETKTETKPEETKTKTTEKEVEPKGVEKEKTEKETEETGKEKVKEVPKVGDATTTELQLHNKEKTDNKVTAQELKDGEALIGQTDEESLVKLEGIIKRLYVQNKNNSNYNKIIKIGDKETTGLNLIKKFFNAFRDPVIKKEDKLSIYREIEKIEGIQTSTAIVKAQAPETQKNESFGMKKYTDFLLEKKIFDSFVNINTILEKYEFLFEEETALQTIKTGNQSITPVTKPVTTDSVASTQTTETVDESTEELVGKMRRAAEIVKVNCCKTFNGTEEIGPIIFAKGNGKGKETIQTLLGDGIEHGINFKKKDHYKEWANIKLDELDSNKMMKEVFAINPKMKENATSMVNSQAIALIQLSAERLFKKSDKYEGKTSAEYSPNVRQNFIIKPRDKEVLGVIWEQDVLKVKGMFRNYLDMNALDPKALLAGERNLGAKTATTPNEEKVSSQIAANAPSNVPSAILNGIFGLSITQIPKGGYGMLVLGDHSILVNRFEYQGYSYYKYCGLIDSASLFAEMPNIKNDTEAIDLVKSLKYKVGGNNPPEMKKIYNRFRCLKGSITKDDENIISAIIRKTAIGQGDKNLVVIQYNKEKPGDTNNEWVPYVIYSNQGEIRLANIKDAIDLSIKKNDIRFSTATDIVVFNIDQNKKVDIWGLNKIGNITINDETARNKIIASFTNDVAPVWIKCK